MRQILPLMQDWKFFREEEPYTPFTVLEAAFDDAGWVTVNLPHDWSVEHPFDPQAPGGDRYGFLPAGIGYYRKTIGIDGDWLSGRIAIHFDGVFRNSDVYVNGTHAGHRPNGNVAFEYDITDLLHPGRNLIAVRVDNSRQPCARWYTGSGIHRPVHLIRTSSVHVAPFGVWVQAPLIDTARATVRVEATVRNASDDSTTVTARTVFRDQDGSNLVEVLASARIAANSMAVITAEGAVDAPRRWSPEEPFLYHATTCVEVDGVVVDGVTTRVGFRTIELDPDQGFILNGQRTKLRGFCIKEDAGPLGVAVTEGVWRRKLGMLKEIGCNALRVGHYPFPSLFYDLCDEMGFMVMDEFFDGWDKPKAAWDYGRDFHRWWRRDAGDTIERNRNHPCVVIWSIGNEVHRLAADKTRAIAEFVRSHDTDRPITMGRGYEDMLDAAGFNGQGEFPGVLDTFHRENPRRPIILTEAPHRFSTRGFYRTRGWVRDPGKDHYPVPDLTPEEIFFDGHERYFSSYDNATIRIGIRDCLQRTTQTPWIAGQFHWTAFDYMGEAEFNDSRKEGDGISRFWPHGVVDMCLIPKDDYYYYQSQWTNEPMLHLLPHWTHRGMEGVGIAVWAYTNCEEVELFLNGESLGRREIAPYRNGEWIVPYRPGVLEAIGYREGREAVRAVAQTAEDPVALRLNPDLGDLPVGGDQVTRVELAAVDKKGTVVPWASDRVCFRTEGPVRFLGAENGDRLDTTPCRRPERNLFYGKAASFWGATNDDGLIELSAAAICGERLFTRATTVAIAVAHCMLRGKESEHLWEVRYTLDGSEPDSGSPLYRLPFTIEESCDARALVIRDGEPWCHLAEEFRVGEKQKVVITGHEVQGDMALNGPRDKEAQGRWHAGNTAYDFEPDGSVVETGAGGISVRAGTWWYDFPNDLDECPDDNGTGELLWANGKRARLRLTSRAADRMNAATPDGCECYLKRFNRKESP